MTTITEQVRAAAEEIERGIYKAFSPNTPDDDIDLADWVKTTTRLDVAEIINKHVHPASLTDAIEALRVLRDEVIAHLAKNKHAPYDMPYASGRLYALNAALKKLESLEGKAPVSEPKEESR